MSNSCELNSDTPNAQSSTDDFDEEINRMILLATAISTDVVKGQACLMPKPADVLPRVVVVENI